MNEQNISNVIEYLEQNPDQTTESLVISLLNEGYPVQDIKAALDRLGISPVVIPGYKETIIYSSQQRSFPGKMFIIIGIILSLLIIVGIIAFASTYFTQSVDETSVSENTPAPTSSNPITEMKGILDQGDYKITIDNLVVYLDNGKILRKEANDGKIYLNWSGVVTILNTSSKTYRTHFPEDPEAIAFHQSQMDGVVPIELIEFTQTQSVTWTKSSENEWESKSQPKQKITIDPKTKLVSRRTILNADGTAAKEDIVIYEKVANMNSAIGIPTEYSQAQ